MAWVSIGELEPAKLENSSSQHIPGHKSSFGVNSATPVRATVGGWPMCTYPYKSDKQSFGQFTWGQYESFIGAGLDARFVGFECTCWPQTSHLGSSPLWSQALTNQIFHRLLYTLVPSRLWATQTAVWWQTDSFKHRCCDCHDLDATHQPPS